MKNVESVAAPVGEEARIRSLDVLRGVAVLGIFVMNSRNFGLPLQQFDNPAFPGKAGTGAKAADLWAWGMGNLLFEDKMIAIFSMLFGAGMVLGAERIGKAAGAAAVHYKRMFWLLVIAALHAYGLWYGDILNTYAICGAIVYPLRRLRPGLLIGLGIVFFSVTVWIRVGPPVVNAIWPDPAAPTVQSTPSVAPQARESTQDRIWRESLEGEEKAYHGSYLELARWRARLNTVWHWYGGIGYSFWRCGGLIIVGMGLARVLDASGRSSVYWGMMIGGYGAGVVLVGLGFWPVLARALGRAPEMNADARRMLGLVAWAMRYVGAPVVAIGHAGLVMLLCRSRRLRAVLNPLAAAGRMALTNYLMQTVIAVLVFDGWAGGQWGKWTMARIAMLVAGVWVVQLVLSLLWLKWFRFGPAEWAWRSATYGRVHGMRRG